MMNVIEINNLYFKYRPDDEYLLKNLNLTVKEESC